MDEAVLQKFLENPECGVEGIKEALQNPDVSKGMVVFTLKVLLDLMWSFHRDLLDLSRPVWLGGPPELSPTEFDRAISKVQSQQKRLMKSFRGIDAHRPQKNSTRDAKIWKLRQEHPDWSLPRIGRQVGNLSRSAVGSALLREQRRIQERDADIGRFLELLAASIKQALADRNLETKALPQGPTVQ